MIPSNEKYVSKIVYIKGIESKRREKRARETRCEMRRRRRGRRREVDEGDGMWNEEAGNELRPSLLVMEGVPTALTKLFCAPIRC